MHFSILPGPVIGPVPPQNEFIHFSPDVVESHVVHDHHVVEEKCVDKVEYVEEYVQDEEIKCHHSYEKKCQTSFTTDFESVQEEECDETFQKDCFIEYKKVAIKDTVQVCHTPLVKDCNLPGPVECKTEYETMCEKFPKGWVVQVLKPPKLIGIICEQPLLYLQF